MTNLVPYDQARVMLAEAKAVDDVKSILDKSAAMAEYARRAADRSLEIDAIEIRFYAERRLGQMLVAQNETVGFNRGRAGAGRPALGGAAEEPPKSGERPDPRPTLAEAGISKKLSAHAQKMAAVPAAQFEARLKDWRDEVSAGAARVTVDLLKIGEEERQRQARRDLAQALSDASVELTGTRRYPAIYFDPPWKRKQGITDRSYENHYTTMSWDEIILWAHAMRERLLDDAWGFMWVPRAHAFALHPVEYKIDVGGEIVTVDIKTPLAWAVARAMGFDAYSTAFDWTKTDDDHVDDAGTGILVRDQDEWLLMFKKGRGLPKPRTAEIFGSNHRERSKPLGHSRKPQHYREMIAKMTGGVPILECFARHDEQFPLPPGWDSWGNQATPTAPQEAAE